MAENSIGCHMHFTTHVFAYQKDNSEVSGFKDEVDKLIRKTKGAMIPKI